MAGVGAGAGAGVEAGAAGAANEEEWLKGESAVERAADMERQLIFKQSADKAVDWVAWRVSAALREGEREITKGSANGHSRLHKMDMGQCSCLGAVLVHLRRQARGQDGRPDGNDYDKPYL